MSQFSDVTTAHMSTLALAERKRKGQYMTPADIGDLMVDRLFQGEPATGAVLDPAVGTGELLLAVKRYAARHGAGSSTELDAETLSLHGFDIDEKMVEVARRNLPGHDMRTLSIFDKDWLPLSGTFQNIVANPPYFEMKKGDPDLLSLWDFDTANAKGRVNIFSLFFEYALRLLTDDGRMVFLVPPSMNSGAYFSTLRETILTHGRLENLEVIRDADRFEDAQTSIQIVVVAKTDHGFSQNLEASSRFVHVTAPAKGSGKPSIIFTDRKSDVDRFMVGRTSISDLGFRVFTGPLVWNQHKGAFSNTGTPLLYAKDITDSHTVSLSGQIPETRRWLPQEHPRALTGPFIVVNRVVGSLENPNLRFALVPSGSRYQVENHVNVIVHDTCPNLVEKLFESLTKVSREELSFYLQAVTGNTQLSATELSRLPVSSEELLGHLGTSTPATVLPEEPASQTAEGTFEEGGEGHLW